MYHYLNNLNKILVTCDFTAEINKTKITIKNFYIVNNIVNYQDVVKVLTLSKGIYA